MTELFAKILHLDAVSDLFLLTKRGELLYSKPSPPSAIDKGIIDSWRALLDLLQGPQSGRFVFENGSCGIFQNALGFVVVGLKKEHEFDQVKFACTAFEDKIFDSKIRKELLLEILEEVDDFHKLPVIDELALLVDPEVGESLVRLLKKHQEFKPDVKDALLVSICRLLGECSTSEAADALTKFIEEYLASEEAVNPEVEQEARVSLQQLEFEKQQVSDEKETDHTLDNEDASPQAGGQETIQPASGSDAVKNKAADKQDKAEKQAKDDQHPQTGVELQINKLLDHGKKQDAISLIMKYIEAAAQKKMFDRAEKLRDTLIQIDSMMLSEIIKAAEIIEEYKAASIDQADQQTWASLSEILGRDEFTSLYHAMTRRHYPNGDTVVKQGALLSQLIFVNSGQIQLFTNANGSEVPLKVVRAGEVIGGGTFFEASVWTTSVRSLGAELLFLSRKRMEKLAEKHSSLESRLIDFSAQFVSANAIFRKTNRTRRQHERKTLEGRATASLLDKTGKEMGISFKGDLFDISRGGMSFCVRVSKKKNANMLFGSRIRVGIPVGKAASKKQVYYTGKIVAVRGHHVVGNEYSLHVQFDKVLTHKEMQTVFG